MLTIAIINPKQKTNYLKILNLAKLPIRLPCNDRLPIIKYPVSPSRKTTRLKKQYKK